MLNTRTCNRFWLVSLLLCLIVPAELIAEMEPGVSRTDILINLALPGYLQIKENNPEGYFLLSGTALVASGYTLMQLSPSDSAMATALRSNDLVKLSGSAMAQVGSFQLIYSNYDVFNRAVLHQRSPLNFLETLYSPFDPRIACDARVAPIVLLEFVSATSIGLKTWSYVRETGSDLKPSMVQSFGAFTLSATSGFLAGYIEELAFHGMLQPALQKSGFSDGAAVAITGVAFGLSHLTNMVFAPPKTEREWINYLSQFTKATIIGFYNGWLWMARMA